MSFTRTPRTGNDPSLPEKKLQGTDRKTFQAKGSEKSRWDLYKDGLTQGSINLFLQCREQFRLHYCEGWSKTLDSDAIEFGSVFHHALALYHAESIAIDHGIIDYQESKPTLNSLSAKQRQNMLLLHAQVKILLEQYIKFWGKVDDPKKWVVREETFNIPYPEGTLNRQYAEADIPLRGRFDGIFRKGKSLWLHETKTKGRIDEEAIQLGLPFDTQTMLYMYAAEQQLGEKIAGVCYDVIRRPAFRQGKNKAPEVFLDRVAKDVAKQPKHYFMRWDCTLLKGDLQRWVDRQLDPILIEIRDWWESIKADPMNPWNSPKHYMNPNAFNNQYGRASLFYMLTKGQTFGLIRRKHCYPELED